MALLFLKCIRLIYTKCHVKSKIVPRKFFSRFGWQGYSPRFFAIFGQKIDFCFNSLNVPLGPLTPEQKKKFEKNKF
jgi:hypothetical protein